MLDNILTYPQGAESDPFFAALATALLPILGYDEDTEYYCSPRGRYCTLCGECGRSRLMSNHEMLYHALFAASGAAFCFDAPEDDDCENKTYPGVSRGWRWDDEFVDRLARVCGVSYCRRRGDDVDVSEQIANSLSRGYPVLARLGASGNCVFGDYAAWCVVTGCDGDTLRGWDSCFRYLSAFAEYADSNADSEFILHGWRERLNDAIIFTGRVEPSVSFHEILRQIIDVLRCGAREDYRREVFGLIDGASGENAQMAAFILTSMTGYPIEARWHAAEAFCSKDNVLVKLSDDEQLKAKLADLMFCRYIKNDNDETHGVCWKIWNLLGGWGERGYELAPDAAERICQSEVKAELRRLYTMVFDNDEAVLRGLCELVD